jgi:hypothetical protein
MIKERTVSSILRRRAFRPSSTPRLRRHLKSFSAGVAEVRTNLAPGTPVEVWFQDEMPVGHKNKLPSPRCARSTHQPTDLFGAVCPDRRAGAALVLPACNSEAFERHLDEIATKVAPGAPAIRKELRIANNISLLPVAAALTRAQQPREQLAVHASELAVKPHFQIIRRRRRSLLLRLEHTYRPTVEDHAHRPTRLDERRSPRIGITYFRIVSCPLSALWSSAALTARTGME